MDTIWDVKRNWLFTKDITMVILTILVLSEKDETIYGSMGLWDLTLYGMYLNKLLSGCNHPLGLRNGWGGVGMAPRTNAMSMIFVFSDRASLQWSSWIWNKGSQLYVYVTIHLYDSRSSCTNICSQAKLENGEGEFFTVKYNKVRLQYLQYND